MVHRLPGVVPTTLMLAVWAGASWALEMPAPAPEGDLDVRQAAVDAGLDSLDSVAVPRPSELGKYVKNEDAAIALGKALFWDMQVGSDGQACASCHFHAGGDNRTKNQLTPGLNHVDDPSGASDPDLAFGDEHGRTGSGAVAGPNYTLVARDFPFHRLEDPDDRESCNDGIDNDGDSEVDGRDRDCFDTDDATSSQGTLDGGFIAIPRDLSRLAFDQCGDADASLFHADGLAVRKVEPRNTPTMINAVFNFQNFWDGRASDRFNGLNPLGERGLLPTTGNPSPGTLYRYRDGTVGKVQVRLDNASLASQAVGPPLSDFEMSCASRTFADLGRKLIPRVPLAFQKIDAEDSVLGSYRLPRGTGLRSSYRALIQRAFSPEFWSGTGRFDANGDPTASNDGYTQMEVNFPLFFGIAIQLYESTLVADDSPFDAYMRGEDALDEVEEFGLEVFVGQGNCVACHAGPELTGASVRLRAPQPDGDEEAIERMFMGDGGVAVYDGGFYNIGVRPTFEDLGVGADLAGFPLSFSRQVVTGNIIDDFAFDPDRFEVPGDIVLGERVAVDGAFKVPGLRNVELTGPYFHNGGQGTLGQVVDFYDRGGDRVDAGCDDTTGFAENCSNLDPDIQPLGLDQTVRVIDGYEVTARDALVAFLLTLTDDRVRTEAAPFDHPQLFVPNGHAGNQFRTVDDGTGEARTILREIPATGEDGARELGTFLGLDPFED